MTDPFDGIAVFEALRRAPRDPALAGPWADLTTRLEGFLDALAGAAVTAEQVGELGAALAGWTPALEKAAVPDADRLWGHSYTHRGRGQALVPAFEKAEGDSGSLSGTVRFGRFHSGENGVVHGGAIALFFDDVLGQFLFTSGGPPCRTAYLTTNFRAAAPVGAELTVRAWVDRIEGRKRFVRGTLHAGETLCAEAEGLWVALRPGQP